MKKIISLLLTLCLLLGGMEAAFAKTTPKPSPTPPPTQTAPQVVQVVPEKIQELLDLAYNEWSTLNGKSLRKSNKYTKWRNNYEWGWCAGFITWCMLQIGVPMDRMANIQQGEVEGIVHVKEASVGKLLRGYQKMNRATDVPQKGFILVYGVANSVNKTTHVGLVYDVQDLGNGKYRITTIEGNMSSRVKMYVHDYDRFAPKGKNLSAIPESERTEKESNCFSYKMQDKKWYVNRFLMPWVPEEYAAQPTQEPVPVYTMTPAPSMTPAPTPAPGLLSPV